MLISYVRLDHTLYLINYGIHFSNCILHVHGMSTTLMYMYL